MSTTHPQLERFAKGVLLLLAVYHVLTGVVAVFFPETSFPVYNALYHADPLDTAQYRLILKPWGAYAMFTGAVLFSAWREPRRFRPVILALIGLLSMRCGYRLICAADAWTVFGIDGVRNWTNVLLMASYVVVLAPWCALSWWSERSGPQSPASVGREAGRLVGAAS